MTDPFEEIETAVLGVKLNQTESPRPAPAPVAVEITPLVALFQEKNVRVLGSTEDPLFSAADVANYIGDKSGHYARTIAKYTPNKHVKRVTVTARVGQRATATFLTESGLYKFLMQSKGEKAEEFQEYTYDLLKAERKRTVDAMALELKIANTKYEEMRRAKISLGQQNENAMRAANDARGQLNKLKSENATLLKQKYAREDAEFMRKMGRGHLIPSDNDDEDDEDEGDQ